MTLTLGDRAFETSSTTGTGTLNLAGPVSGFISFVAAAGTGKKVPYIMTQTNSSGIVTAWETGYGVVTSGSPDTLTRNPRRSSNANSAVSWGTGTRNVYLGWVADFTPFKDENMNFVEGFGTGGGTANAQTVTLPIAPLAYSDGMEFTYFATVANTGAMTINPGGLGAKTAKMGGADVPAGAVAIGSLVRGMYRVSSDVIEITSSSYFASAVQPGQAFSAPFIHVQDQKASGTAGGTTTTGSYLTRTLNTVITNTITGASLASNQITLPAGTYQLDASATAYAAGNHKAKIRNITDSTDILIGTVEYGSTTGNVVQTKSFVSGRFTIAATKLIELQHRVSNAQPTNGFGAPATFGDLEVYSDFKITKVA